MSDNKMIVILGATATGKTKLAARLTSKINGEIISADSRQVYRGMDIGTGKDLADYTVDGKQVKAHLVDIVDAGQRYSMFQFKKDFDEAYNDIINRNKVPIVCGGSGMYIESALGLYNLAEVKKDHELRERLESLTDEELIDRLNRLKVVHNNSDFTDRERLIRAIEIASQSTREGDIKEGYDNKPATDLIFGIQLDRTEIRNRISSRLEARLKEGLIDEVKLLLEKGISSEDLLYYGLEYKYVTLYLTGKLTYEEMYRLLNTAIHQFAKRQMTWYRRMEKRGINIHWVSGTIEEMIDQIENIIEIS